MENNGEHVCEGCGLLIAMVQEMQHEVAEEREQTELDFLWSQMDQALEQIRVEDELKAEKEKTRRLEEELAELRRRTVFTTAAPAA